MFKTVICDSLCALCARCHLAIVIPCSDIYFYVLSSRLPRRVFLLPVLGVFLASVPTLGMEDVSRQFVPPSSTLIFALRSSVGGLPRMR